MEAAGPVYLVGAGPGDPELLTVKALRLIQEADVVVYDRLVSDSILELVPSKTRKLYVGKESGHHSLTQDRINEVLLNAAGLYRSVVRLKGGDPYIFGRGGEEALFLKEHGISVEVVPGITSAAASSAATGIPLTHRGLATGVRFVTGHLREDHKLDLDWDSLAQEDTTLVIYMGLSALAVIARRLIAAGLPAETPALAIENATTPQERKIIAPLNRISRAVRDEKFKPPTLIVIGKVVSLADQKEKAELLPELLASAGAGYA
ncbi:uroporphyrinogen-III C-methyltransferase [Kiloniella laminariae]|uniref:uroporphyrinogen-III C-methyltransferase n=1 Tax=Kiloniella laminariae TaxID=454162 RepID=UPI000378D03D|nr:uroporphyrinogen-III C-methyltransferase [Kiloniella laminariae]